MRSPLRILHLEDDPKDAELVQGLLETEGIICDVTRVETQPDFFASLEHGGFDLILADYSLPSFDGLSALKVTLEKCPDIPFIFVSGRLGEEVAIEALKIGATDYVLKERLSRVVPSVRRALHEVEERTTRKQAEEKLRRSEAYLSEAQRLSHTGSTGLESFHRRALLVRGNLPNLPIRPHDETDRGACSATGLSGRRGPREAVHRARGAGGEGAGL